MRRTGAPNTIRPASATNRPPADADMRTAATIPAIRPTNIHSSTPTTSGRIPGSTATASASPIAVYARLGRSSPNAMPTRIPTTIAIARAPTIRRAAIPTPASTAAIATDTNSSTPWSTPHISEPRTHSPIPSDRPMTSRNTAKMTSAMASAMAAARRPTSPAMADASALARSMWAKTSAMRASRVALSWARMPARVASSGRPAARAGRFAVPAWWDRPAVGSGCGSGAGGQPR